MFRTLTKSDLIEKIRQMEAATGKPPTQNEFCRAMGVTRHFLAYGYWSSWNEARAEAGFPSNTKVRRADSDLLEEFGSHALELRYLPRSQDLLRRARQRPTSCWHTFVRRFKDRQNLRLRLAQHWNERPEAAAILAMCDREAQSVKPPKPKRLHPGFVYLMRCGDHFKIGKSKCVPRRRSSLAAAHPDELTLIHQIQTDDSYGIECYWHRRFKSKRSRLEWFILTEDDVKAFCSHSTM